MLLDDYNTEDLKGMVFKMKKTLVCKYQQIDKMIDCISLV